MTRRKLRLKLIEEEKTRAATLQKRLQNLKKKAHEFSILCDVDACLIVFKPGLEDSPSEVELWPSDRLRVDSIIDKYKRKVAVTGSWEKTFNVFDFFNLRRRQVRDKVAQVCKANFEARFPTWDDRIDGVSPEQIASCLTKLDLNIEAVKRKIMLMKEADMHKLLQSESRSALDGLDVRSRPSSFDNYNSVPALSPWNQNLDHNNHTSHHAPMEILNHFNHIQAFHRNNSRLGVIGEQPHLPATPNDSLNPMLSMPMMNDLNFEVRSVMPSSSNSRIPSNVMYAYPPSFSVCHDPRFGMPNNNVMFDRSLIPFLHHPRSNVVQNNLMFNEPCFYAPSMQSEVATYNQQQVMMPHVFRQKHHPSDFYHETDEDEMRNKKQRF